MDAAVIGDIVKIKPEWLGPHEAPGKARATGGKPPGLALNPCAKYDYITAAPSSAAVRLPA